MTMVRIWVHDGILASGVSGPIDVLAAANVLAGKGAPTNPHFEWRVESLDGHSVRAASGQMIAVDGRIDPAAQSDVVVVTAPFVADMDAFIARGDRLRALSAALLRQHRGGAVVAAYCTGSYLLAEAGLLDGRVATTHWQRAADFARRYPRVQLRAGEILTEQDGILCGGAVTSFLDLAVRLVEKFAGAQLASVTAKTLLIDAGRVSQASYASLISQHGHADPLVARAQRRMEDALCQPFRLAELAAHLAVSERTLSRRFQQAVRMPPLEYLQRLRVEVAKKLLETTGICLEEVSERVGYSDPSTFRQLFRRLTGLTPREYRLRFSVLRGQPNPSAGASSPQPHWTDPAPRL
ncbi:MAG TPA: helix-turn-helix domain-containing protein [Magnetospirillum sp.]|nr:helix-turn-helix domain-containing protein [Magnetospirillum sp.]